MNPTVELKKPGSQAGRLAQGTSPRGPHTCHPQHTGCSSYTPGPQGWSVGSHTLTHSHAHTHTHTHTLSHTHSHTHSHTPTHSHTHTHTLTHTHTHKHTLSHTHKHTLTHTHIQTHTLTHTQHSPYTKGHQRPKPRKEILYQSVRKFASTGRTGQSREKKTHGVPAHPPRLPPGKKVWGSTETGPQMLATPDPSPLTFHNPKHPRT